MSEPRYYPDANRVGILTATVLLAYALTHLVQTPQFTLEVQLPGFYVATPLGLGTLMILLAAGLSATGMDWLLRSHPSLGKKRTVEHWLLPTLATFIVGVPLSVLPAGSLWWIGFGLSGLILILVFIAEYIVVDPTAPGYAAAAAGLTALSYAIYFIFATAMVYGGARLYLLAPAVFLSAALVSLRNLHLQVSGRWQFAWGLGIGLVSMQISSGLHYWPLSPLQFGLILLGPLYAMTNLAGNLIDGVPLLRTLAEPFVAIGLAWGLALIL